MSDPHTAPTTLGGRLRWARELGGVSARELDRLAERTTGHAATIETLVGDRAQISTISDYADVLGVSLDWLVKGRGRRPTKHSIQAAVAAARTRKAA